MGLINDLKEKRVCIDTAPFIYYIEKHGLYKKILNPVFKEIDLGGIDTITSTITLLEVMVLPMKTGNENLAHKYREILLHADGLTTYEISHQISEKAAQLRANYSIKTPDALQISTGIIHGADIVLTNDSDLKRVSDITILSLDDYIDRKE